MEEATKSKYLDILQIFRGIAALMVVCHHAIGSIGFYHKIEFSFFNNIALLGKLGVDFFFVLSGFIISYTVFLKYNEPNSFKNYIKNRLIRIYVPYLPIGILLYFLYVFLPDFSNSDRDISTLTSLTLIPYGKPALSVAWTLSFELFFYFLFSISFFSRKAWNYFVVIWFVSIVVVNYTSIESREIFKNPFFVVLFSTYNIEFIFGYILTLLLLKKYAINLKLLILILAISILCFFYCIVNKFSVFNFSINFLFAIISFIIIYLAIVYFNKRINKFSILMLTGNATYSIYLIHNPLQMIVIRFLPTINSVIGLLLALILVFIIVSLCGYLYYYIFEKKAIQKIKKLLL